MSHTVLLLSNGTGLRVRNNWRTKRASVVSSSLIPVDGSPLIHKYS